MCKADDATLIGENSNDPELLVMKVKEHCKNRD